MKYLILGATGTLGRATVSALLESPDTESITCLSRDELKQFEMKRSLNDSRLHFVLGDVRDKAGIEEHFEKIDTVFHFAALKRIPEMESQPLECLKTNVLGTINVAECARKAKVRYVVFSSTDKACLPVNTYGASKFLSEQILFSLNTKGGTVFSIYRWGNVVASRGSVIHLFRESLEQAGRVTITNEKMSRFWIRIEDAVAFMLSTYKDRCNFPKVPKMKAATVVNIAEAVAEVIGKEDFVFEGIGMRPGEKIHEDIMLTNCDDRTLNSKNAVQYSPSELKDLIKDVL